MRNRCIEVLSRAGAGTDTRMNSDTLIAMAGLMGLAAAVLTGALWGSPVVTASFRWLLS
jgi:hypothetical protein